MSFLRYAKSGHVEKRVTPAPRRAAPRQTSPKKRAPRTYAIAGVLLASAGFGVALALPNGDEPAQASTLDVTPVSEASTEDVIERAERLHREAQARLRGEDAAAAAKGEGPAAAADVPVAEGGEASEAQVASAAAEPSPLAAPPPSSTATVSVTDRIRRGETLSVALTRHGVSLDEVNQLVVGLKGVLDVRSIRPGDAYTVIDVLTLAPGQTAPEVPQKMTRFEFRPKSLAEGPTVVIADLTAPTAGAEGERPRFVAQKVVTPITEKVVALSGEVDSSLYIAMKAQGEGSALVNAFADVFAWNIDFYRETMKGDTFKVIVEKRYAEGRFVGYGKVLAAEYVNAGTAHRGFNFTSSDKKVRGIFDQSGDSLERTFLKSAVEVTRLTSQFGQRFHPVLKRWKAHNGIDYGAPTGTPFWAVADGVVKEARFSPTAGNMVVLRHANGYETEYFHASRFAKGLHVGQKVKQRQVIGYVGSTGRSTGPHLHFGMRKGGHYVDPNKQRFPSAKPVPAPYLEEYVAAIAHLRAELAALPTS